MNRLNTYLHIPTHIAPLAMFRVLFGFIMLVSILRFMIKGWVYEQYVAPEFYFTFYGFEWVRPWGEVGMYSIFVVMAIAALMVMLGAFYRVAIIVFFLCFTYVELIDKTNYLNHYYFVSLISFLLIWVPANRYFSLDVIRKPIIKIDKVPLWTIGIFKLQLAIVYFYAGVAKLNPDWMLHALPLKMWLPAGTHLPLIGSLLGYTWVAYAFSWFGAIYDLSIPFLLLNKRTRLLAYGAVVVFHLSTWILFPIGMFPFIMILATLIFFPAGFHLKMIAWIGRPFQKITLFHRIPVRYAFPQPGALFKKLTVLGICIYILIQIVVPWRFLLYPGKLFWTEQGYRFSWRVMLMEKAGYVIFYIKDPKTGGVSEAYASDYLTPNQEKMMATQPDMILQYAHFLAGKYKEKGIANPEVRVAAYVTLNGTRSKLFIDPKKDLTTVKAGFRHKDWILPFEQKIPDQISSNE